MPGRVFLDDDEALLALLARLRGAQGLWVDLQVLSDLVGGQARFLLSEMRRANLVQERSSPIVADAQYRIA